MVFVASLAPTFVEAAAYDPLTWDKFDDEWMVAEGRFTGVTTVGAACPKHPDRQHWTPVFQATRLFAFDGPVPVDRVVLLPSVAR